MIHIDISLNECFNIIDNLYSIYLNTGKINNNKFIIGKYTIGIWTNSKNSILINLYYRDSNNYHHLYIKNPRYVYIEHEPLLKEFKWSEKFDIYSGVTVGFFTIEECKEIIKDLYKLNKVKVFI